MNQNNYTEWRSQARKEYMLYESIYIKLQEMQTNVQWQGADKWLPEEAGGKNGGVGVFRITKE